MATRFWVGGSGTWDAADTSHWSATSGGASGASVPTSSDTVTFDSNSGAAATVTIGAAAAASSVTINKSDLTLTHSAGSTVTGAVTLTAGTLNTNGQTCSWGSFSSSNSNTRTLTLGASAISLTGTGTVWDCTTATNLTVTANTATITLATASSAARTFAGGGKSYGTLTYTVASSPGSLTVTGANTFGTLNVGPGRPLVLPSGATTTVTNMNAAGVPNGYQYLPGTTGNYLSTPDSAALSITGDIDIRVRVALDDWTPSAVQYIVGKLDAGIRAYGFAVLTTGILRFQFSQDGSANITADASVAPTVADGAPLWVRVTRRSSDGRVQFFTASGALTNPTAGDFTQLGTDISSTSGAIFDSTCQVYLGAHAAGSLAAGKLYRAQIRNGLDGTLVFDADLTSKTCGARTFTESSSNGATVTVNGSSAQAGDGCVVLAASTPGTFATLAKAGGGNVYGLDYLSISDIHATP